MWTFFSVLHYLRKIFTSVQRISLDTSVGLNENKFDRKKDMTAFGISFNNISFKVIYYL